MVIQIFSCVLIEGGKGEGARMISVVKTKDGIIRKVLSGGNPNDMKKIIGQSVRVKTPQNNSSKMLQVICFVCLYMGGEEGPLLMWTFIPLWK